MVIDKTNIPTKANAANLLLYLYAYLKELTTNQPNKTETNPTTFGITQVAAKKALLFTSDFYIFPSPNNNYPACSPKGCSDYTVTHL